MALPLLVLGAIALGVVVAGAGVSAFMQQSESVAVARETEAKGKAKALEAGTGDYSEKVTKLPLGIEFMERTGSGSGKEYSQVLETIGTPQATAQPSGEDVTTGAKGTGTGAIGTGEDSANPFSSLFSSFGQIIPVVMWLGFILIAIIIVQKVL